MYMYVVGASAISLTYHVSACADNQTIGSGDMKSLLTTAPCVRIEQVNGSSRVDFS